MEQPAPSAGDWPEGPWGSLRVIAARRPTVLLVLLVTLGGAALHVRLTPSVYRATARLQILRSHPAPPLAGPGSEWGQGGEPSLSTLAKIARSSRVALRASQVLAVEQRATLSVGEIRKRLKVTLEEPDVLAISAESTNAAQAAALANAVMDTFVEENRDVGKAGISAARHFLERQLPGVLDDLRRAEAAVKRFKAQNGVQESDPMAELKTRIVYDYGAEADRAQAEVQAAESELASLERRLATQPSVRSVQRVVTDPVAEGFRAQIARAEVALANARTRYDDSHPRVLALQEDLAQLRRIDVQRPGGGGKGLALEDAEEPEPLYRALQERVRDQQSRVDALRARAKALSEVVAKRQASLPSSPRAYVELARLERIREGAEKGYLKLLDRLQGARMDEVQLLGASRVIDRAIAPDEPARPKPLLEMLLAAAVGLAAGSLLALAQGKLDTTIRSPEDVAWHAGMETVGTLPRMGRRAMDDLIAARAPKSSMAEALRMMQARLAHVLPSDRPAVVMVTSGDVHEGKSFIAANLAILFAQMRVRTVLVEMDLRRTRLHRTFGVLPSPGVADVLAQTAEVSAVLRETSIPDLRVLARGSQVDNPSALFATAGLANLVADLRRQADMVVIDTPPVLALADTLRLAPHADATLLVVEQGRANGAELAGIRCTLEQAGAPTPYVVLNKVRGSAAGDYRRYRGYYSEERLAEKPEPPAAGASQPDPTRLAPED